ncbi:Stf0 family sulfotransferase [Chachezhania sediminis]|uniref:Stf0 family sulfotransferase n=1 Tax=Chachezhania sediminis TaxID=2599291 RepID=UPI00131C9750|nr:Stf0 family sulfotransferase [Chachezhania sediminis]
MPDYDGYILCGTPRTGSTMLCDLLVRTGVAGSPDSYFMDTVSPYWLTEWSFPARGEAAEAEWNRRYLDKVIETGRAGTDVFALRLMRADVEGLSGFLAPLFPDAPTDRARLEAAFGRLLYVHLSRRDRLAQAVSYVRARQTGLWHVAPDGTEIERLAPQEPDLYDHDRIAAELAHLERLAGAWDPWFADQGIEPLRVVYEDLADDPGSSLQRICTALGVPAPETVTPGVAKLTDPTNAEWIARFRRETGMSAT